MKKAPLRSVLLLLLLAVSTGCSRYYWSKPDATAEQFTQDNQACVKQAARTLPAGAASLDAVRQYYRTCLNSRGYVRDKQLDPPPPGSFRGIENSEEFNAAAQASMAQAPPQGFEQQLAQLDDLKARGRITEDEYGDQVSLVGRPTGFQQGGSVQSVSFSLTWEGPVLRGTFSNATNVPRGVEFRRERP